MPLTLTPLSKVPLIRHGDNLADILVNALQDSNIALQDNDILVLAQKIVSKAEGRMVNLGTVTPSQQAIDLAQKADKDARVVELMLQESNEVLRVRTGTIIVEHKLGFICANAGIDHSNVSGDGDTKEEYVLLLPENTDKSASEIRKKIESVTNKKIGVLIIDSHGRAWRNGTVGVAVGISGIPGLVDLRGKKDLFGYTLRVTQVGAGDELAAAASLMMGQASEGTPVVHVRGFPFKLRESALKELLRPKDQDLFR
jgi:coenzyme F420-0:L-glutamate ligase / coenzyme F420-1:gamma-L-glutamate ligase